MDTNKAIEIVREYYPSSGKDLNEALETLIPELKESEDKAFIELIKGILHFHHKNGIFDTGDIKYFGGRLVKDQEILAWLKKKSGKEYALKSFNDEDVHKFVQYIERQAKAYEITLPNRSYDIYGFAKDIFSWLEKQGGQNLATCNVEPTRFRVGDTIRLKGSTTEHTIKSIDGKYYRGKGWLMSISGEDNYELVEERHAPFKAEHGKYYYCIKDYFSGGKKQASKGDVVQALRGLPIMGLDDASEFFLPVNNMQLNNGINHDDCPKFKVGDWVINTITKR